MRVLVNLVLRYHVRQLAVRRWSTIGLTMVYALVAAVLCYLLVFADGLKQALTVAVDPLNLIVLAEGATAESNSAVSPEDAAKLAGIPHLAKNKLGAPLVSPEVVVQTNVTRRAAAAQSFAGVAVRGVDLDAALAVRPLVTLAAGRWFQAATDELVVGVLAAAQFDQGTIGSAVECGDRRFTVVGSFRAGGSALESEFWGHSSNVADAYRRDMYSSAVVRLTSSDGEITQTAIARIASSFVALRAIREAPYYAGQSENARAVQSLALVIVLVMGVGAVFAAVNALSANLAGRTREIQMLRLIGCSRRDLLAGLIAESVLVALAGGLLGCTAIAAYLAWGGGISDLVGTTTFTSVAFTMTLQGLHIAYSLLVSLAIGTLGGSWPAYCTLSGQWSPGRV